MVQLVAAILAHHIQKYAKFERMDSVSASLYSHLSRATYFMNDMAIYIPPTWACISLGTLLKMWEVKDQLE